MLLSQMMEPKCRRSPCLAHPTSQGHGPHGRSFSEEILHCSSASNHSSQCLVLGGCICPGRELRAQVWRPKQPSSCWGHASCCSCPAQDCPQPAQGPPQVDGGLSVQCLMAQAAWLAQRAPSISLETRSLGTGIDAAGSLNINASLGSGNQGEGGRQGCRGSRDSLPHTTLLAHQVGWDTGTWLCPAWMGHMGLGQRETLGSSSRQEKNEA